MALMEWDGSLSVNVSEIDEQHRHLVDLLNSLNEAMKERKGKEALGGILKGMVDYAAEHFTTEENYFDRFGYPGGFVHKREHRKFVERVLEFKKGFDSGELMLSLEVMTFLKDWLGTHIKGSDKGYTRCFNENGLN